MDSVPGAWAFVVSGKFINTAEEYTVSVTNTRTNVNVTDAVKRGYFATVFGDLTQKAVAQVSDVLTVHVLDPVGNIVVEPTVHTVTSKMMETAFVSLAIEITPQPEITLLLEN